MSALILPLYTTACFLDIILISWFWFKRKVKNTGIPLLCCEPTKSSPFSPTGFGKQCCFHVQSWSWDWREFFVSGYVTDRFDVGCFEAYAPWQANMETQKSEVWKIKIVFFLWRFRWIPKKMKVGKMFFPLFHWGVFFSGQNVDFPGCSGLVESLAFSLNWFSQRRLTSLNFWGVQF